MRNSGPIFGAVEIRLAHLGDAEATRAIYNVEVLTSKVTFDLVPRSLADQEAWLAARTGAHVALVAVEGDDVLGFAALSAYKERPAYSTSVEDSVYVAREHQGRGVGRALLGALIETAEASGFHAMFARIVGGHRASIALHATHGFEIVGTERQVGRKFGTWLDVVVMERLLR